jgi:hypothetical protein
MARNSRLKQRDQEFTKRSTQTHHRDGQQHQSHPVLHRDHQGSQNLYRYHQRHQSLQHRRRVVPHLPPRILRASCQAKRTHYHHLARFISFFSSFHNHSTNTILIMTKNTSSYDQQSTKPLTTPTPTTPAPFTKAMETKTKTKMNQ